MSYPGALEVIRYQSYLTIHNAPLQNTALFLHAQDFLCLALSFRALLSRSSAAASGNQDLDNKLPHLDFPRFFAGQQLSQWLSLRSQRCLFVFYLPFVSIESLYTPPFYRHFRGSQMRIPQPLYPRLGFSGSVSGAKITEQSMRLTRNLVQL